MIEVRQAAIADLEVIVPLFDAYRQFYRQSPDEGLARRFLLERFQRKESAILLALERESTPVGFVQLFPSFSSLSAARTFILNDLFVSPNARRQGAGSLLLSAAADFARAAGAVRLTLSTEIANHAAQMLYEAEGWTRQSDFHVYQRSLA